MEDADEKLPGDAEEELLPVNEFDFSQIPPEFFEEMVNHGDNPDDDA